MQNKYTFHYTKKVIKFLDKHKEIHKRFFGKLKIMSIDPYCPTLDVKKLQGIEKGCYRLRIGDFRFKYKVIDQDIVIYFFDADSRGDIYK